MAINLVYHKDDGLPSPFDVCAVEIAQSKTMSIACPYFSLSYLKRLVECSVDWRILTDISEWLASTPVSDRQATSDFILKNAALIREHVGLHAKVMIGSESIMVGSANLTISGIQCRTEMSVLIKDESVVTETSSWFNELWNIGGKVDPDRLKAILQVLPDTLNKAHHIDLKKRGLKRDVDLVAIKKSPNMFYYKGAKGYFTGDKKQFCVVKGSPARSYEQESFRYSELRSQLIQRGVLKRENQLDDYRFTDDYLFTSRSAAASIVSGQSRSGPAVWKPL